jgi:hypothetical protein
MRHTLVIFLLGLLSCQQQVQKNKPDPQQQERCLFERPLIIGASISRGHGTKDGGPGAVLARLTHPSPEITNRAISGATSVQLGRRLKLDQLTPSIVLGLDLFFWDAARNQCGEEFLTNLRELLAAFQRRRVPVILGKVPMEVKFPEGIRLAGKRPCAAKINELLEVTCLVEKNCLLYDTAQCLRAMGSPKDDSGRPYFSDDLHTTEVGNVFCAEHLLTTAALDELRCSGKD